MFISKKKLKQMLEEQYWDGYKEGHDTGVEEGRKKGYKTGLHEGLIANKKGIRYAHNGLYLFEDGIEELTGYKDAISNKMLGNNMKITTGTMHEDAVVGNRFLIRDKQQNAE